MCGTKASIWPQALGEANSGVTESEKTREEVPSGGIMWHQRDVRWPDVSGALPEVLSPDKVLYKGTRRQNTRQDSKETDA